MRRDKSKLEGLKIEDLSDLEVRGLSLPIFQMLLSSELKSFRLELRFYIFSLSVILAAHIAGFSVPIKEFLGAIHL
jgi:hypothetical protein